MLEQFVQCLEFGRVAGVLFIDKRGAVGRQAAHEERAPQPQHVHFVDERLVHDLHHDLHVAVVQFRLLVGRRNPNQLVAPRRQFAEDRIAGAAQQDRPEPFAELPKALIAEHLPFVVPQLMAGKETKSGAEPPIVDEFHHREQFVEPVFQGCSGEHQREGRVQAFDDAAGFRFPVFDPLAFIQDDQVPRDPLDRQDVADDLFVVADREEAVVAVQCGPFLGRAVDQQRFAAAEALYFVAPLGFQRRRGDDQHFADTRLASQHFGDADRLDGFAQPHFVGQDRAAGPDSEGDAVQLIGQQLLAKQFAAKRVVGRVAADIGDQAGDPFLEQPLLQVFLGVRVDEDIFAERFEAADPPHQVGQILDRLVPQRRDNLGGGGGQFIRDEESQFERLAVVQMQGELRLAVGRG